MSNKREIKIIRLKKALSSIVEESLTVNDFMKNFKKVIEHTKKIEEQLAVKIDNKTQLAEKELEKLINNFYDVIEKAKRESDSTLGGFKKRTMEAINSLFTSNRVNQKLNERLKEASERISQIKDGIDGKDGRDGRDGLDGKDGKDADEEKVAVEASKLALQSLLSQKMGITLIKGLKKKLNVINKKLKELKKAKAKVIYTGGGGAQGGGHVRAYDLSSSLDGSTKTFALPAFWRVISVHSSSFPNVLRPTTDYTTDASAMTITFTSEITASSTLATGQTIIIVYAEQ